MVTRGLATYKELDEYLSCDDAIRLIQMLRVKDYNEWLNAEKQESEVDGK